MSDENNTWFLEKLRQRAEAAEARVKELEAERSAMANHVLVEDERHDRLLQAEAENAMLRHKLDAKIPFMPKAVGDEIRKLQSENAQLRARLERAEAILFDLCTGYWVAILDDNDNPVSQKMGQRVLQYWREYQ